MASRNGYFSLFCWHARVRPDTPREEDMSNNEQIIAMPQLIRLGGNTWREPSSRSLLLTPYGDINAVYAEQEMDAAMATHPREACMATYRMLAVCGRWGTPRPYGEVLKVLEQAQRLLKTKGWRIAPSLDGVLQTGAHVLDLTTVFEYPAEPGVVSYNAAKGFSFEAEKPWISPEWGKKALANASALAEEVYGLL